MENDRMQEKKRASNDRNDTNHRGASNRSGDNHKRNANHKVVAYRRSRFKDPGVFLFLVLAFYLTVCVVFYLLKPHISTYEVTDGSIAADYSYRGMAVRSEQTVSAPVAGAVTYYARESEKVGAKTNVYSIDESGRLSELMSEQNIAASSLSGESLRLLMEDVDAFYSNYSDMNYSFAYQFKQEVEGMTLQLLQQSLVESAADLGGGVSFQVCQSPIDGIISYRLDGYEGTSVRDVTADMLKKADDYSYQNLQEQTQVQAGDFVFKVITEDSWSIVIAADADTAQKLVDEKFVEVNFKKDKISVWGATASWMDGDQTLVSFTFTNSMIRYAQERYLDISFELDDITGLKVPKSSVAERELYAIPIEYLEYSENGKKGSVYYETYDSNGEAQCQLMELDIAYESEETAYINKGGMLEAGNVIVKPESNEHYTIGKTEKWIGVYNYNKGYAVFCPINILYEGNEYCIIRSQTKYGLAKYDYIVLDSAAIDETTAMY